MKKLKTTLLVFAFLLLLCPALKAQETLSPEKRRLIGEIITLTKVDKQVENSVNIMLTFSETSMQSSVKSMIAKSELPKKEKSALETRLLADQSSFVAKFRERFNREISPKLFVEETMYPLYGKFFSETELADMAAFYKSPTGQKLVEQMPNLMTESFKITEEKFLPRIQKIAEEIIQERINSMSADPPRAASRKN